MSNQNAPSERETSKNHTASHVGLSALLGGGSVAIAAARRLLQPRKIASDDFNDLIANCQQRNLDVVVVAEAYLRSELKIESMAEWCLQEREVGNGGCGACSICCGERIKGNADDLRFMFRLAAEFLRQLSERLGNAGCNDWEWPEWLPEDQRRRVSEIAQRNNGGEPVGVVPMDFIAVDATATFLCSL